MGSPVTAETACCPLTTFMIIGWVGVGELGTAAATIVGAGSDFLAVVFWQLTLDWFSDVWKYLPLLHPGWPSFSNLEHHLCSLAGKSSR